MLHILICDDDLLFAQALEEQIVESFRKHRIDVTTRICASGSVLRRAISEQTPDIVFLDLLLRHEDGYQLAAELRSMAIDPEIVFVTNYPERMPEAFAYRPIGFIAKPPKTEDMNALASRFLLYYRDSQACYCVNTRERAVTIPPREIRYFESSGHHVLVYHRPGEEPIRHTRRLDEVAQELQDRPFIRAHKSFLVHAAAIGSIDKANMQLILKSGDCLPVSRRNLPQAIDQFIQYQLR